MPPTSYRHSIAGWILLTNWILGGEQWHFCDDVGYRSTLCGRQTREVKADAAILDDVGEPQPNDCQGCRRKLEERVERADDAEPASA